MMAFAVESYTTEEPKSDPRYIRWNTQFTSKDESGVKTIETYQMHPCTDEEFARFDAPESSHAVKVNML